MLKFFVPSPISLLNAILHRGFLFWNSKADTLLSMGKKQRSRSDLKILYVMTCCQADTGLIIWTSYMHAPLPKAQATLLSDTEQQAKSNSSGLQRQPHPAISPRNAFVLKGRGGMWRAGSLTCSCTTRVLFLCTTHLTSPKPASSLPKPKHDFQMLICIAAEILT